MKTPYLKRFSQSKSLDHNSSKVSVLFVRKNSNYQKFANVELFDIDRDAKSFPMNSAIVAHPPCRLWGKLHHFSTAPENEKFLAIYSINLARILGGVVEHPSGSTLFEYMDCGTIAKPDENQGYVISVDQSWFGHPCIKRTYLYICGVLYKHPAIPLTFNAHTHTVSSAKKPNGLLQASRKMREYTPILFCAWLLEIARIAQASRRCLYE